MEADSLGAGEIEGEDTSGRDGGGSTILKECTEERVLSGGHRDPATLIREVGHAFGFLRDTMYGNEMQACTVRLWSAVGPRNMIIPHTNHLSSEEG